MSTTQNKQLVEEFMNAMSSRDVQALAELTTEDLVYRLLGTAIISGEHDKAGFLEVASGLVRLLEGEIAFEDVVLTAEDYRVAAEFTGRGLLIDGRSYENTYHALFFFRGDKVCKLHELFDTKYADEFIGRMAPAS
jgi:ketosteroid isomerase-like protein